MAGAIYELTVTMAGQPPSCVLLGAGPHRLRVGTSDVLLAEGAPVEIEGAVVTLRRLDAPVDVPEFPGLQRGELIGRGGMGAVYSAWDPAIGRNVAMKTMLVGGPSDASARFAREAQITGRLEHPSIVPVHELGSDAQGNPFYTMKFVRGVTLRQALADRVAGKPDAAARYSLPHLLTALQKVCDAVAFAHSRGVIHRDLKPDNIMLGDFGEVFVLDWGLAKEIGVSEAAAPGAATPPVVTSIPVELTAAGLVMGTPAYMAPEQARGEAGALDERTDVYALGALLYQILALRPPVGGANAREIIGRVAAGRLDPLVGEGIPDSLAAVVAKAMKRDPAERYASVRELQADLDAYQSGFATRAEEAGLLRQVALLVRRHRTASAGLAATVVVGLLFGGRALVEGRRAERALTELRARVPGMLEVAVAEAKAGRFLAAAEKVDEALTIDPSSREAKWRKTSALIALERFAEAREAASGAGREELLPDLAVLAEAQAAGRELPPEALRRVAGFLKQNQASAEARGLARRIRPDTQAALAEAQAVIGQRGGRPDAVRITSAGTLFLDYNRSELTSLEAVRGLALDHLRAIHCGLADLGPLQGMRLTQLAVSSNAAVSDLSPLAALPLSALRCSGTSVRDIAPLKGLPLNTLELAGTLVSDLRPLAGLPLANLEIGGSPVSDLSPLADMPLEDLRANECPVTDLSPLRGRPLRVLWLRGCRARDYSPLSGLPLQSLDLSGSYVTDLQFLAGSPIRELNLRDCPGAQDLSPLMQAAALDRLGFNGPLERLAPLRRHPKLAVLIQADGEPDVLIGEVWRQLDARVAPR